jgi:hypothetical protein
VILDESGDAIISSGPLGRDLLPVIYQMKALPKDAINWIDKPCGLDRLVGNRKPQVTTNADTTADRAGPCRLADIAVETDWEYTANIFGGNTTASAAYAVTLMAADSEIYQRDVHTRLRVSFLRVWSDANDPYTTTDNYERIFEFQNYWNANMTHIQRHAAHFLAGVLGSTGGVAYYPGLCQAGYDYGLSSYLSGYFPYPLVDHNGQNWDLMVTAHELGHNFGAPHTHDVGIDGCGNGDCSHATQGTIMSYCHTCSGGMSNIVMNLHNVIINDHILPYLANDAPLRHRRRRRGDHRAPGQPERRTRRHRSILRRRDHQRNCLLPVAPQRQRALQRRQVQRRGYRHPHHHQLLHDRGRQLQRGRFGGDLRLGDVQHRHARRELPGRFQQRRVHQRR